MKRKNNLYSQIISIENLQLADARARKGKGHQSGVKIHQKNQDRNIEHLHQMLLNKDYKTSAYSTMTVYEPKERIVYKLPYFPDRITHHAILNVLEPIFTRLFTGDTYSSIKGRGIHKASEKLKKALKDFPNTTYCLKLDITKFYPTVDHEILKSQLRRKFKDRDLLWLLDEIIDSAEGLPIGNYLSQYFANFYLTGFDHWIKETMRVKNYFRYADDIVILSVSKEELHALLNSIERYLKDNLNLSIKGNFQVFPVEARGIDFVGYVHYHTHTLMRKSIKKNFVRAVKKRRKKETIAAYWGWAKHCNSKHLIKKIVPDEPQFQRFRNTS
ncbi:RNA-directed DNA polymerase [Flavobacterium suncheonense]|uniref:Reverse transcriptase n=1 Tax=Flavobacterium suncheonense GH29-5 = DSM 17707 TaxID=1121899 RepID=A0A0A2MBW8_9FLAO|nr:RNA-directed DNA polymerase [Flavobacterium suncheonense]KGO89754.1 reverse transcriptase [Flavobacterium suncheonense GH29-5 = DSM 17707]